MSAQPLKKQRTDFQSKFPVEDTLEDVIPQAATELIPFLDTKAIFQRICDETDVIGDLINYHEGGDPVEREEYDEEEDDDEPDPESEYGGRKGKNRDVNFITYELDSIAGESPSCETWYVKESVLCELAPLVLPPNPLPTIKIVQPQGLHPNPTSAGTSARCGVATPPTATFKMSDLIFSNTADVKDSRVEIESARAQSEEVKRLQTILEPAQFGDLLARETRLDEKVRKCLTGAVTLEGAGYFVKSLTRQVHEKLFLGNDRVTISLRVDKLNYYKKDGLFGWHVDTPTAPDMVGTVVVALGGGPNVGLEVKRPHASWRTDGDIQRKEGFIPIVAFFSDCPHRVLKKKSTALSLTFKIFCKWAPPIENFFTSSKVKNDFEKKIPCNTRLLFPRIDKVVRELQKIAKTRGWNSFGILSKHDAILGCPQPLRNFDLAFFEKLKRVWPQTKVIPVLESRSYTPGGEGESERDHCAQIYPISLEALKSVVRGGVGHDFYERQGPKIPIIESQTGGLQIGENIDNPTYNAGNNTESGSFAGLYFRSLIVCTIREEEEDEEDESTEDI